MGSQFGPFGENTAFLVDGYVSGGTAITVARRNFPKQFLHYHRAGHGAVTSPQTQRGYTAFVHTKISRVIGASGIHVGTMSFGKMEGDASDKNIAFMLQDDVADGPYYTQQWEGMPETTPIISGGMNALRLPAFFQNLGHSNVILTAGGGAFGHKDGPKQVQSLAAKVRMLGSSGRLACMVRFPCQMAWSSMRRHTRSSRVPS